MELAVDDHRIDQRAGIFDDDIVKQLHGAGFRIDGDDHGNDKANPPWGWDDGNDGPVYRGDFFFQPAMSVATWLDMPGEFSLTYLFNPYLP